MSGYRRVQVLRTKFNNNNTKKLIEILVGINWNQSVANICRQLNQSCQFDQGKYVWMVGSNPSYFIQYQVDSYAIFKAYNKVILAWKPKYLEYPSLVQLSNFGQQPKLIKSMEVSIQQKYGRFDDQFQDKLAQYVKLYYGIIIAILKSKMGVYSRICSHKSNIIYWHCGLDDHQNIDVSSKKLYIRYRIKGVKQKYDKDLVIFSHQGVRQFMLKGKGYQIITFLSMLIIFIAVISCSSDAQTGMCSYKDEMILASAAVMMGLMGLRVATRNKYKKKLDKKISQLQKKE